VDTVKVRSWEMEVEVGGGSERNEDDEVNKPVQSH
jgi:hypothetical protein